MMEPSARARPVVRFLALIAAALPISLPAATLEIPIALDYRIVEEALAQQMFTGPDRTADVFADDARCNTLVLSNPRVSGGDDGRLRLVTDMQASVGTPIGGACRFARSWNGVVETEQTAQVAPGASVVTFQIVDSRLLRAEDGKDALPRFMQGLIRDYVHPRLGAVTLDLGPAVGGIQELFAMALPEGHAPVSMSGVEPQAEVLVATLALEVADTPPDWDPDDEPPLTEDELAAWDANWQAWDVFATWTIKTLAVSRRCAQARKRYRRESATSQAGGWLRKIALRSGGAA
jgi:hypothetical protein